MVETGIIRRSTTFKVLCQSCPKHNIPNCLRYISARSNLYRITCSCSLTCTRPPWTIMYNKLSSSNGKGMYVADCQVVHVCHASDDLQGNNSGRCAIELLDLIIQMELTCDGPSMSCKPGMFLCGMYNLCYQRWIVITMTYLSDLPLLYLVLRRM